MVQRDSRDCLVPLGSRGLLVLLGSPEQKGKQALPELLTAMVKKE